MKRFLTSCFGLGLLPVAPGTWGSVPVAVVFGLMCYYGASMGAVSVVMVGIVVGASAVCVLFGPGVMDILGKEDPGEIVADEVAGQAVAFLGAYAVGGQDILIMSLVGFIAFRVFDIFKPWPCKRLEKITGGWGVLADDLMAGVYVAIILQVLGYFLF